jgi:hypothetical protein
MISFSFLIPNWEDTRTPPDIRISREARMMTVFFFIIAAKNILYLVKFPPFAMRKLNSIVGLAFSISFLLLCGCKKAEQKVIEYAEPDSSWLSITNASPSISNLLFYENNEYIPLPDSPFSFGNTTSASYVLNSGNALNPVVQQGPYIKIPSGYVQLGFRSPSPAAYFSTSNYFEDGLNYSIFITDSISHGQPQYVLLNDKTVSVDSTEGQIRFINLCPDAPALDIWAFLNVGPNGTKIFSNCGYLPNDYNSLLNAQTYVPIAAGPYYMVATVGGTYNAVLDGGIIISPKSVITMYVEGFFNGSGSNLMNIGIISYQQP